MKSITCKTSVLGLLGRIPLIVMVSVLFFAVNLARADETATDDGADTEESYYSNPAQAAHAGQLADEVAEDDPEVQQALDDYEAALEAYNAIEEPTEEDLKVVEELEAAYEDILAEKIGVASDDIAAMRASGMGWGDIAHELGVHPALLGLGHTRGKTPHKGVEKEFAGSITDEELAEATTRTMGRGLARGHGQGINSTAETTTALASAGIKSRKDKSSVSGAGGLSSSGRGNSSSNSNAGGNSDKGNSGNKGGNSSNAGGNKGGNSDKGNNGKGNGKK